MNDQQLASMELKLTQLLKEHSSDHSFQHTGNTL